MLATPPVFGSDSVNFFKASARTQYYFPLAEDLTLMLMGEVAYGDGYSGTPGLPFWGKLFCRRTTGDARLLPQFLGAPHDPECARYGANLRRAVPARSWARRNC